MRPRRPSTTLPPYRQPLRDTAATLGRQRSLLLKMNFVII